MTTSNTTAKPESPLLGRGRGEASYFSIQELTASATALREGIDNRPNKCAYHLLHVLVKQLLDPIREAWGKPIIVSSGYRCKQLNALVGGAKHSHHILGCAADIISGTKADHRRLFKLIQQMQQEGRIWFTQLIWEGDGRWIHISYVPSDLKCQVIARSACG
jgi:hypothetical protein